MDSDSSWEDEIFSGYVFGGTLVPTSTTQPSPTSSTTNGTDALPSSLSHLSSVAASMLHNDNSASMDVQQSVMSPDFARSPSSDPSENVTSGDDDTRASVMSEFSMSSSSFASVESYTDDDIITDDVINDIMEQNGYLSDGGDSTDIYEFSDSINEEYNNLMLKPKPDNTWNTSYELIQREHGLVGHRYQTQKGIHSTFNSRFYASRHVIETIKLSMKLKEHNGCVNSLSFDRAGDIICSGSDDRRIIAWNWRKNKPIHIIPTCHQENIFQTKLLPANMCLDILSSGRDGQIRRNIISPSGDLITNEMIYRHHGAVHKLVICPHSNWEIISVGEDGLIRHKDLRTDNGSTCLAKVICNETYNEKVILYCIAHHPIAPEICVCGCDNFVRTYDTRNMKLALHKMCPQNLQKTGNIQVTGCVYNKQGSEVLASYSDHHIYLFDNINFKKGTFLHSYKGHYNSSTIKGVNFFGPNSEYVISGSDCGNTFFWDKNTEAIINYLPGKSDNAVNCLESHPAIPMLATSGLDSYISIWMPSGDNDPYNISNIQNTIKRNLKKSNSNRGDANAQCNVN